MFPAVGAIRKQGTTVVLEDIAFPVASLASAITDLQILFKKFNYQEAIIFGHAKDGNIHFVITQDFSSPDEIQRYDEFINEVVDLTIHKYNGSLKAEHGTGRNMAPFVETEWGPEIYAIMKRIKSLADPKNLFNPGVIINDDPKAHLKNIKPMPSVAIEVDKCIECGYCEPNCPSRNLTITPRQRIQLRREMVQMDKKSPEFELLLKDYQYSGLDTCAVDGMCANDCPVDINTGELVKRLRRENHSPFSNKVGVWVAGNFNIVEKSIRLALRTGVISNSILGKDSMVGLTKQIRKLVPEFPLWINGTALPKKIRNIPSFPDAIYFQTCISRLMGGYENQLSLPEALIQVSESLGVRLLLSPKVEGMCCSQPFASKGFESATQKMANSTIASLYELSNQGRLPIVVDTSSCTHTLQNLTHSLSEENKEKYTKLTFLDSVDYVHDMLLPKITNIQRIPKVALHPVCSLYKSGIVKKMKAIAEQLADNVEVPLYSGCCGMAGDRGFHFPELTHSAAAPSSQYLSDTCNGYYSSSRTCELSMSKETGKNYESIVFLLLEALGK
jgi:D-lactate dehydrogenase